MADPVDSFTVPIGAAQPSRLYVSGEKLTTVAERFAFDDPDYDGLPAREIDGE